MKPLLTRLSARGSFCAALAAITALISFGSLPAFGLPEQDAAAAPDYQFASFHHFFDGPDDFIPLRRLYVSPQGDDRNEGLSPVKALRTISKAVTVVQPGDLVTVSGGVYCENVLVNKNKGTKEHPIVFRAAEDETAVVTYGYRLADWKKEDKYRFTYVVPCDRHIADVWDEQTLTRYVPHRYPDIVDGQPGSFYQDEQKHLLYVHTIRGVDPEQAGVVVIPSANASGPVGAVENFAFHLSIPYCRVEGFTVSFCRGAGFRCLDRETLLGCQQIRNNIIYGCFGGMEIGLADIVEGNDCNRNYHSGIFLYGGGTTNVIRNNLIWGNNTNSPLHFSVWLGGWSYPFNFAFYGPPFKNADVSWNTIISTSPRRDGGNQIVLSKNQPSDVLVADHNVFVGGSGALTFGQKKTSVSYNTVINGNLSVYWGIPEHLAGKAPGNSEYNADLMTQLGDPHYRADNNLYLNKTAAESWRVAYLEKDGFADPSHLDFRLRADSPHLGKGAYPQVASLRYVSPTGDDTAVGTTPGTAWRSPAKAFRQARAGDTVYVLPGTYVEKGGLTVSARGTAEQPIRFRNYRNGEVVIKVDGDTGLRITNSAYIDLSGFVIEGAHEKAVEIADSEYVRLSWSVCEKAATAVRVVNSGKILLENNTFHRFRRGLALTGLRGNCVVRNNLFAEMAGTSLVSAERTTGITTISAPAGNRKLISERNAFSGNNAGQQLTAWQSVFHEVHESIVSSDSVAAPDYQLPYGSVLAWRGIGNKPIGARGERPNKAPVIVEQFRVLYAFPDRAILSWETPLEYPNAHLEWKDASGKIQKKDVPQPQGLYRTVMTADVENLKPNTPYDVTLTVASEDGRSGSAAIQFRTSETTRLPATLHVSSSDGNDRNDGLSPVRRFKTISRALLVTVPGDTVLVAPGVYHEELAIKTGGLSKEQRFVLRSEMPGKAIFDGDLIRGNAITMDGVKHVTIDGFDFSGLDPNGWSGNVNINNAEDVRFINNRAEPRTRAGGLVNVNNSKDIEIRNNLITAGTAMLTCMQSKNVLVVNNTFYRGVFGAVQFDGTGLTVMNNIIYNTALHDPYPASSAAVKVARNSRINLVCDYNLYWRSGANAGNDRIHCTGNGAIEMPEEAVVTIEEARKKFNVEHHGVLADPLFVDPDKGDFRLKPGSPAVGMGKDGATVGYSYPD